MGFVRRISLIVWFCVAVFLGVFGTFKISADEKVIVCDRRIPCLRSDIINAGALNELSENVKNASLGSIIISENVKELAERIGFSVGECAEKLNEVMEKVKNDSVFEDPEFASLKPFKFGVKYFTNATNGADGNLFTAVFVSLKTPSDFSNVQRVEVSCDQFKDVMGQILYCLREVISGRALSEGYAELNGYIERVKKYISDSCNGDNEKYNKIISVAKEIISSSENLLSKIDIYSVNEVVLNQLLGWKADGDGANKKLIAQLRNVDVLGMVEAFANRKQQQLIDVV